MKANKVVYILGYAGMLVASFAWGWNYNYVMKDN